HHGGVVPFVAERIGIGGQAFAQVAQVVGQSAGDASLVDVGVPAADIDEAEAVLVAHQGGDAPRFGGEAACTGCAAAGLDHLVAQVIGDRGGQRQSVGGGGGQRRALVHVPENRGLSCIEACLRFGLQRDVGDVLAGALETERQAFRERNRRHAGELTRQACQKAGTE